MVLQLALYWVLSSLGGRSMCPQLTWLGLVAWYLPSTGHQMIAEFFKCTEFSWNSLMSISVSLVSLPPVPRLQLKFWYSESISLFCSAINYTKIIGLPWVNTTQKTVILNGNSWYPFGRKSLFWGIACAFKFHCLYVYLGGIITRKCELPSCFLSFFFYFYWF